MKILSLNIWGAPYAKHRQERVALIADEVIRLDPDIVLFQEVYLPDNREDLIDRLKSVWVDYHYFPSGLVGSGLLTMSKHPIVDRRFMPFTMRGKPDDIMRGDYYAQKGIGLVRVETSEGMIDVYNCHTHAQYDPDNNNEYAVYTETNLYEATRFIDSMSGAGAVVLCGDLNTRPDQAGYEIITSLGSLVDAYKAIAGQHDFTFYADNPYSGSDDQCLDYVLVRNIGVESVELVMTEYLTDNKALAYSDHVGLLATVDLQGEQLKSYESDLRAPLERLYQRVSEALVDTETAQYQRLERSVVGLMSVIDLGLVSGFLSRYSERLAKFIRRISIIGSVSYAIWQVIQVGLNLQPRKNALRGIRDELRTQLERGRLFDGRELGE